MQAVEPFLYFLREPRPPAAPVAPPEAPKKKDPDKFWEFIKKGDDFGRDVAPPRPVGVGAALGLSQSYKCTEAFLLEVTEGGGRVTIRQPRSLYNTLGAGQGPDFGPDSDDLVKFLRGISEGQGGDDETPGNRGRITEWSMSSRRNFRKFMGGLLLGALDGALMVGLTYPAEFPEPDSHGIYKGHLRAFKARFQRQYPGASFVWKLEFQQRGAAHYHLVVFGLGQGDHVLAAWKLWADKAWFEIVGSGDEKHLRAGVSSEWVRSVGGATAYLIKYLGKDDQTRPGDFTGRYWGCFNKLALPVAPVRKEEKSLRESYLIRRVIRKCTESQIKARKLVTRHKQLQKTCYWFKTAGASVMDMQFWFQYPGQDRFMPGGDWGSPSRLVLPDPASTDRLPLPPVRFRLLPKHRTRNNLTATLYCNASVVARQLEKWASDAVNSRNRLGELLRWQSFDVAWKDATAERQ